MPTFNQLVRKGREVSEKRQRLPHFSRAGTQRREEQSIRIPPRREACAQPLRPLHLKSLTRLSVRSPE